MGGRVWAREVPARSSTPKNSQQIVVERCNFVMESSSVNETNVVLDDVQRSLDTRISCGAGAFTLPGPLSIVVGRSCDPTQSDNGSSYCHRSVLQQQDPARNQPRTSKRSQMPDKIRLKYADCPDDDRHR